MLPWYSLLKVGAYVWYLTGFSRFHCCVKSYAVLKEHDNPLLCINVCIAISETYSFVPLYIIFSLVLLLICFVTCFNYKLFSFMALNSLRQCFSTFSLKWNSLQQFWLLTEPMAVARNLSRGNREIRGWRPWAGKRFLERGQQARGSGGAL